MNRLNPQCRTNQQAAKLLGTVEQTLLEHNMIDRVNRILLGVSGGPDSIALLHMLVELSSRYDLSLAVAHLNHNLRPQTARREAAWVASAASRLGLPFFTATRDVERYRHDQRLSPEEAARQVRYEFLIRTARQQGYQRIAIGHQADDNAELVLMYLMRGSGSLGLAGIPPVRQNLIIRPLIRVTRQQILAYLSAHNLTYCTDHTNFDNSLTRNRVRNNLLPHLKQAYNPGIVQTLNRLAEIMRTEQDWTASLIDSVYRRVCAFSGPDRIQISIGQLVPEHVAVQRRILRQAIAAVKGDLRRISYGHIQDALALIASGSQYGSIDLPDKIRLQKIDTIAYIIKESVWLRRSPTENRHRRPVHFNYAIPEPENDDLEIEVKEAGFRLMLQHVQPDSIAEIRKAGQWVAFFDKDALKFPLVLRNYQPGDRFVPLGMTGRQKLKKYFIDQKVPREQRTRCPVLLSDDTVLWVVGHRTSETAKWEPSTRRVLKITCDLLQR